MFNLTKRNVILASLLILAIIGGLVWLYTQTHYERTTNNITVTLDGVSSAEVVDTEDDNRVVQTVSSGDNIRLETGAKSYQLRYKGATGYADGSVDIDTYQAKLSVSASYSRDRLAGMLGNEKPSIRQIIDSYASNLHELYDITDEALYIRGDWYGTILEYKGDGLINRDNVVLVLHKTGDDWTVVTDPPLPSVSIDEDRDIQVPLEVRRDLNDRIINR